MSKISFKHITYIYTNKCNAECSHCILSCGPTKTNKLSPEIVKKTLKDLFDYKIQKFSISGGEPFLFFREIESILSFSNSMNLKSQLGTNGYWGISYNKSFEILKKLHSHGLTKLLLSADKYHQKYVKIKNIFNILMAAKDVGVKVKISTDMTRKDQESFSIIKKLEDFDCLISLKQPKLIGRATKNVNRSELCNFIPEDKKINSSCDQIDSPTITPDGRVWICCGNPPGKYYYTKLNSKPFVLGNIYKNSLKEILERNENYTILKILKNYGPIKFVEIIENATGEKYKFRKKYHDICDLCIDILGNKKFKDILKEELINY